MKPPVIRLVLEGATKETCGTCRFWDSCHWDCCNAFNEGPFKQKLESCPTGKYLRCQQCKDAEVRE